MRDCAKLSMRYKGVGQSLPEGALQAHYPPSGGGEGG